MKAKVMSRLRRNRVAAIRDVRTRGERRPRLALIAAAALSLPLAGAGTFAAPASLAAAVTGEHVVVSFTFDDGRASQYKALSIFGAYGMHATFYVNTGFTGTSSYYMTWAQLQDLAGAGHEISGHTAHHTVLNTVTKAQADADIQADFTNLAAHGLSTPVSFAYPNGVTGTTTDGYDVKLLPGDNGYLSARSVNVWPVVKESIPPADSWFLHLALNPGDNTTTLASLQNAVTSAEAGGSSGPWVIFLVHDIDGTSGLSSTVLGQFLAWLQPRAASGTVVKTIRDVIQPATANQPPVADAGPAQTVAARSAVQLDGSGSYDPEGSPLTYQWSQTGGTPVTLSSTTAVKPTFTAPATSTALTFQLVVSDGQASSSPATVTITVADGTDQPPVADAGPAQTVAARSAVQLDGSGSYDPEGSPLTYQWSQTGGTPVTLSSTTAVKPTFTAPATPTTLSFQLVVSDGLASSNPATVTIKVVKKLKR